VKLVLLVFAVLSIVGGRGLRLGIVTRVQLNGVYALVAVASFLLAHWLTMRFIRARAPFLIDEATGFTRTSAVDVVPAWVTHITSIGIGAVLAVLLPWIVSIVRAFL
jgi:hypothetical protein